MTAPREQEARRRWRARNDRDASAEMLRATRLAIELALETAEGRELTRDARALLGVLWHTTTWTKTWDAVYLEQFVKRAGIRGEYAKGEFLGKHTGQSLKKWSERGVIVYKPGRFDGEASIVGLPGSELRQPPLMGPVRGEPLSAEGEPLSKGGAVLSGSPSEQQQQVQREDPAGQTALPDQRRHASDLWSWGNEIAARAAAQSPAMGTLERLLDVCADADVGTRAVLESFFDRLPPAAIEHARNEVLAAQPRSPSAYAVGIAKRMLRQRGHAA